MKRLIGAAIVCGLCVVMPGLASAQVDGWSSGHNGGGGTTVAAGFTATAPGWVGYFTGYWRTETYYLGVSQLPICSTFYGTGGREGGACVAYSANANSPANGGGAGANNQIFRYNCTDFSTKHWNIDMWGGWNYKGMTGNVSCGGEPPEWQNPDCSWDAEFQMWVNCSTPILMPTDKKALKMKREEYKLSGVNDGVLFDIDADGIPDQIAWTEHNSGLGFLGRDRNGNGLIDNGSELYGNSTPSRAPNGFSALAREAGGRLGLLETGHPLYDELLLWTDADHNGVCTADEIIKFADLYSSITLSYEPSSLTDKHGNRFLFLGNATIRTGSGLNRQSSSEENQARVIDIYDVAFGRAER